MTSSGYILIMMLHLVKNGDTRPVKLDLKEVTIVCDNITSTVMKQDYKYMGLNVKNGTDYISSYTDIDELNLAIDKQCKRKGK